MCVSGQPEIEETNPNKKEEQNGSACHGRRCRSDSVMQAGGDPEMAQPGSPAPSEGGTPDAPSCAGRRDGRQQRTSVEIVVEVVPYDYTTGCATPAPPLARPSRLLHS